MQFLHSLNAKQQDAVRTTLGPLLILAGAGSGKTTTLAYRIAYLIYKEKVNPFNILAVTFTNKAAKEMNSRVRFLIEKIANQPNYHGALPMMGTFHSVCVRILRKEIGALGYKSTFNIYDTQDQLSVIKDAMSQLSLNQDKFNPRMIHGMISSAKNELVTPQVFSGQAQEFIQEVAARVYERYQELLKLANALDFDDLIMKTVELFEQHPDVLARYQDQFQYILVDEYQDTNRAQYRLIHLMAQKHRNLCVVGDDWQCLPAGTMLETPLGPRSIETIAAGDQVLAASGYGKTSAFKVAAQKSFHYKGKLITIKTAAGRMMTSTPNHILFGRFSTTDSYVVYLMYVAAIGYRIGIAKGTRFDGKKHDTGLRVRANQECADRMWVLKVCKNRSEAMFYEALYAYQYGIPMSVFRAFKNRFMKIDQAHINKLYDAIDTRSRAKRLMRELGIAFEYPHFIPQATTRNGMKRINMNVVLFGDKRASVSSPWSASRISANTADRNDLYGFSSSGYKIRTGRAGTYRSEVHNLDYGSIEKTADLLIAKSEEKINIHRYAFLTKNKFSFLPASQLHVGMILAVRDGKQIVEDTIVEITEASYDGLVYDVDIEKVHNYITGGIVVHNSIYGWRGAQVKNILNFEKDYPDAKTVLLEENYRSTQTILDVAHQIISKNENQKKKKLWTSNAAGEKVTVAELIDEKGEAFYLADKIKKLQKEDGSLKLNDIVVLYRTNAQSRALEEIFLQRAIPYRIVGGLKFYERKEVKDVMAYLRLLYSPDDVVSFERIINEPKRGIGDTTVQKLRVYAYEKSLTLVDACAQIEEMKGLQAARVKSLQAFGLLMQNAHAQLEQVELGEVIDLIVRVSGYKDYIKDGTEEGETRWENIQELQSVASKFNGLKASEGLRELLEEVALITDLDTVDDRADAVTLMTLHAAKGLEFSCVFMTGLEEGLLPHSRALANQTELEEERRLCYVGLTRAKKHLFLTYTMSRMLYGRPAGSIASRFLQDIERDASHLITKEDLSFGGSGGGDDFLTGGTSGRSRGSRSSHEQEFIDEIDQAPSQEDEPEAEGILGKVLQRKKRRHASSSNSMDSDFSKEDVIDADDWGQK